MEETVPRAKQIAAKIAAQSGVATQKASEPASACAGVCVFMRICGVVVSCCWRFCRLSPPLCFSPAPPLLRLLLGDNILGVVCNSLWC